MKVTTKSIGTGFVCALFLTLALSTASAMLVFDDFEDGVIDTALWIPTTEYDADAAIEETGGKLRMTSRGRVTTVASFPTADIVGFFQFSGAIGDVFSIGTRRNEEDFPGMGCVIEGIGCAAGIAMNGDTFPGSNGAG